METGVKGGNLDDENKKETGLCVLFVILFEFLKCHTYIIVNQLSQDRVITAGQWWPQAADGHRCLFKYTMTCHPMGHRCPGRQGGGGGAGGQRQDLVGRKLCSSTPTASRLSWGEIWGKQFLCFCKNSQ